MMKSSNNHIAISSPASVAKDKDAACHSLTKTDNVTFEPLSVEEQICLVAILQGYQVQFCSPTIHELAMLDGVHIAVRMGVPEDVAKDLVIRLMKNYKNPAPGFFWAWLLSQKFVY